MANFGGHAIPGTFFLFYGFWLAVKHTLHRYWRSSQPKGRRSAPPIFRRLEYIEGGFMMFAAFVGIMVEQFVVDGPHAHLSRNNSWVKLMNWQHSTMYLFFGISGMALVSSTRSRLVPVGTDRMALSLALFVEGFLFYYHLHSRPLLDAHIHSLLLVAVFSGSAGTMLEVFIRENVLLELLRAAMFLLQGTWFYQIGFVLYPPSGPQWDLEHHDNVMFITMCYCWHLAIALLLVSCIFAATWMTVSRCSPRGRDIEIGMRNTGSPSNSKKALLEESEDE